MTLISSDSELRSFIPNVLATAETEATLLDKLSPFLDDSLLWLSQNFIDDEIQGHIIDEERQPFLRLIKKIIVIDAFLNAVPSLDIVLTPNGFGIVSNQNIAPASKERVERLMDSLENERDHAIELLLPRLHLLSGWKQSEQGKYFALTLFPNLSLCRMLGIKAHLWTEYQSLHERLIKIEDHLAETYFSQEQMTVFREKAMQLLISCNPTDLKVIRSLQALEIKLLSDAQVKEQSFFDLVNIIRQNPNIFPEWYASDTASLFSPQIFENKKSSAGYWL